MEGVMLVTWPIDVDRVYWALVVICANTQHCGVYLSRSVASVSSAQVVPTVVKSVVCWFAFIYHVIFFHSLLW